MNRNVEEKKMYLKEKKLPKYFFEKKKTNLHISMKLVYMRLSCLGMFGYVSVQSVAWL